MNGVGDYMRFVSGHHGSLDRVGGIPTHLPPEDLRGNLAQMYFVGQFYCSESRLNLPGTLCLQIYQEAPDDDPWPTAVAIPIGTIANTIGWGKEHPDVLPHDVEWESRPEISEPKAFDPSSQPLKAAKAGGPTFYADTLDEGDEFILQLKESPIGLKLGGLTLLVVRTASGTVEARLV